MVAKKQWPPVYDEAIYQNKKMENKEKRPRELANQPIAVTKTQKARIQQIGKMGDSFSSVIEQLLNYWILVGTESLIEKKQLFTKDFEKKIESKNSPNVWNVKKTWPPQYQEEKEKSTNKELANLIITLTKTQKARLQQIGKMGDSYSLVIDKLLDYWEKTHDKYIEGKLGG